jgi:uncharacterized protein
MSERASNKPNPRALDVAALARRGSSLQGQLPLARLARLASSLAGPSDHMAHWSAVVRAVPVPGTEAEPWLALHARAEVPLVCQRCLQPMIETLAVEREFRFVRSEEHAEREDEAAEEDVLALPPRLDLETLIEDELILALPLVPRHAVCPAPLPAAIARPAAAAGAEPAAAEAAPAHPFAALAALRRGGAEPT